MNIFQDCGRGGGEGGRSLVGVVPAVEVELLDQDDGGRGGCGVHGQHHHVVGHDACPRSSDYICQILTIVHVEK